MLRQRSLRPSILVRFWQTFITSLWLQSSWSVTHKKIQGIIKVSFNDQHLIKVRYVTNDIKPFTPKSIVFPASPFWWKSEVFLLRASAGLISLMKLDVRKDIQSVKSAWSVLHAELKASVLPPLWGNNNKTLKQTHCAYIYISMSNSI